MVSEHGGNIYLNENVIDFSANISPFDITNVVYDAIIESLKNLNNYPDPECNELIKRISVFENFASEKIVCGNGAADLIYRIVYAFKPKSAVICAPTFSEYKKALSEVSCTVHEYLLREENDFLLNDDMIRFIDNTAPNMIFICSPNNPTGKLIRPDILKKITDICLDKNILLVCDECFIDFAADSEKCSLKNFINPSCIILKAFTKFFAMPGIRLGYALCGSEKTADRIKKTGQYWSVSIPAQAAGIAAVDEYLDEKNTLTKGCISSYIKNEREYLIEQLTLLGIKTFSSDANFILLKYGNDLFDLLIKKNILIRDCSNFNGLKKGFYRIAVKSHEENLILTDTMKEVLNV